MQQLTQNNLRLKELMCSKHGFVRIGKGRELSKMFLAGWGMLDVGNLKVDHLSTKF